MSSVYSTTINKIKPPSSTYCERIFYFNPLSSIITETQSCFFLCIFPWSTIDCDRFATSEFVSYLQSSLNKHGNLIHRKRRLRINKVFHAIQYIWTRFALLGGMHTNNSSAYYIRRLISSCSFVNCSLCSPTVKLIQLIFFFVVFYNSF